MTATSILLAVLGLVVVAAIAFGLVSRRRSLPCPAWLHWMVELDNPFTKTNRAAVIIARLDLHPGMAVLDVGCGPGRLTIPLARQVGDHGEVVAMDIQAGMLRRAQEKARAANLTNIRFLEAGAGDGRLARDHFDRAVLVTVLGEIPDRAAALREIFAALKPGGLLCVTEIVLDPHFQPRATVMRLAGLAGFTEKACYGNRVAFALILERPREGDR